ncbi:hypothetical protein INT45_008668 [Circinella minor]|uniref:Uncharacterized protein n=1 Tax=Circinella minor TaxID=1195481 RepID=A0A8H7V9E5_9FUNG|nr:hypothetical protein INT45_008668 [Circinella minor]
MTIAQQQTPVCLLLQLLQQQQPSKTTTSLRSPSLPPPPFLPPQIRLSLCRIIGIPSDHKGTLVFPLLPPHLLPLLQNGREVKQMPLFRQIVGLYYWL